MIIHVYFENPIYVSSMPDPDYLLITLRSPLLTSVEGRRIKTEHQSINIRARSQFSGGDFEAVYEEIANSIGPTSGAIIGSTFISNMVIKAPLNLMWGMIRQLQIIIVLPLFNV